MRAVSPWDQMPPTPGLSRKWAQLLPLRHAGSKWAKNVLYTSHEALVWRSRWGHLSESLQRRKVRVPAGGSNCLVLGWMLSEMLRSHLLRHCHLLRGQHLAKQSPFPNVCQIYVIRYHTFSNLDSGTLKCYHEGMAREEGREKGGEREN